MTARRTDGRASSKRSGTVSLVLLAGAGAAAFGLAHVDPSQDEEEARVYAGPSDCVAAHLRSPDDCAREYETARNLYPASAPHYPSRDACEAHHGAGGCVPGESVAETARGTFLPLMAGYLIGATAAQALPPQPVFTHAPMKDDPAPGHAGGWCTGSGARIWTTGAGRSSVARVSSAALRGSSSGGFGGTGRGFSSSRGGFGG